VVIFYLDLAAPGLSLKMSDKVFQDALIMKELFFIRLHIFSYWHNFQSFIVKFNPGTDFAFMMLTAGTTKVGGKTFLGEREKTK